jgi:hypothetical protein
LHGFHPTLVCFLKGEKGRESGASSRPTKQSNQHRSMVVV